MNYKQKFLDFQKLSFPERKETVIGLLETLRQYDETLQMIYEYITTSEYITDQDLTETYEAVLYGMKQDDDREIQGAIQKLDDLKDRIIERQKLEASEKQEETNEANVLLTQFNF